MGKINQGPSLSTLSSSADCAVGFVYLELKWPVWVTYEFGRKPQSVLRRRETAPGSGR